MKKYFALLFILIIAFVFQGYRMYHNMQTEHVTALNQAAKKAMSETDLEKVSKSYYFTGPESYFVIEGEDSKNKPLFVFVPEASDGEVKQVPRDKGVPREKIEDIVKKESNDIIRIVPGLLNERVVWEAVRIIDDNKAWQYDYYDFYNGNFIKSIKLTS